MQFKPAFLFSVAMVVTYSVVSVAAEPAPVTDLYDAVRSGDVQARECTLCYVCSYLHLSP
ncbi:hypothetical protein OC861_000931 [Tilletia horrida]|nr:hypothetical protein OC861_000931 [Tilletia horrida]